MRKRPLAISIVAFIFIIAGCVGIVYHAKDYFRQSSIKYELVWVLFIRVLAIVCGMLLLRRVNWGRWLAITWLVYHFVLSLYHSTSGTITHFALLSIVSFMLFLPESSAYFRRRNNTSTQ